MICPLSRLSGSPAGVSCKKSCAWWDSEYDQCVLQTVSSYLGTIAATAIAVPRAVLALDGALKDGDKDGE